MLEQATPYSEYSCLTSSGFSICRRDSQSQSSAPRRTKEGGRKGKRGTSATHEPLDALVHGEDDGLPRRDTRNARRDALVEGRGPLFPEHLRRDRREAGPCRLAGELGRALDAGPAKRRTRECEKKKVGGGEEGEGQRTSERGGGGEGRERRTHLIVSIGALVKGPTAPEMRPMMDVCHAGSPPSGYSGWYRCSMLLSSV